MTYKYKLPNNSYIYENEQFSIGTGTSKITYPSNWLALASSQDLAAHGIVKELVIEPPKTPEKIMAMQELKILDAFEYMESQLELEVIYQNVTSANSSSLPFGCDKVTQDNIVGINVAIAVGIPVDNPTYWTPKGYPFPVLVTHQELVGIGGAILNKKNELYGVYFTHKANIMMSSNSDYILTYDHTTGY